MHCKICDYSEVTKHDYSEQYYGAVVFFDDNTKSFICTVCDQTAHEALYEMIQDDLDDTTAFPGRVDYELETEDGLVSGLEVVDKP